MSPEKFQKLVLRRTLELLADREAAMRAQSEGHRATAARLQLEYDQASAVLIKNQLKQKIDQELELSSVCSSEADQIRARAGLLMGVRREVQKKEPPRKHTLEDVRVTLEDLGARGLLSKERAHELASLATPEGLSTLRRTLLDAAPWPVEVTKTIETILPVIDDLLAS